jgi:hypothetical protein
MKKFGLLCLALVLALGALGVGYAAWTDTIFVTGSVSTGEACVEFVPAIGSEDPCPAAGPPPDGTSPDYTAVDHFIGGLLTPTNPKDVGCTTVTKTAPDTLTVVVSNAYPCYANEIKFHEQNCGTVPMIAKRAVLTYKNATGADVSVTMVDGGNYYIPGITQYPNDPWGNVIELQWVNNSGTQREPGGIWEDSFLIHVLQPAKQDTSYSFSITREYIQWDEYITGT